MAIKVIKQDKLPLKYVHINVNSKPSNEIRNLLAFRIRNVHPLGYCLRLGLLSYINDSRWRNAVIHGFGRVEKKEL